MKIVHLNTYQNNGGAGKACLRLDTALRKAGLESEVWVNFSFEKEPLTKRFSNNFFRKWFTAAGIILERYASKLIQKPLPVPFSLPVWGRDISRHPALANADIIHLHWINHAFLRPIDLSQLAALGKPIVWTFHDSNAFTGGCHVRYSCENYQDECGNCPLLKNPGPNDWSHRVWKNKQSAYQKLHFTVVAPSKWMASSVQKSKLLGSVEIVNIPNTLDTAIFKPSAKQFARQKLNLPSKKFILLSGFMPSRKDQHKGTPYLIEAIELFLKEYQVDADQVELVVFGNRDEKNLPDFAINTTFLGTISDDEKLALCYSAADAFIAPSLEDNLPNTVLESLACGTPVVAFETGGIPDMVSHQQNGYLAQYRSADDLAKGIHWIFEHPDRELLNANARKTIMEQFSEEVIAAKHLNLYQSLLKQPHVPA
ncbi:MAG TPA: glycosyltransferase family 4 protein [Daejeonella sp.]|nr:glycosyltransferase family 4 protein [Daejeonella sp.]